MEDAHAAILDLQAEDAKKDFVGASVDDRLSFFGVYDGHGGDKVALFAGENIHKILAKQEAFKRKDFEQALKDGFLATDRAILSGKLRYWRNYLRSSSYPLYQTQNMRKKSLAVQLRSD